MQSTANLEHRSSSFEWNAGAWFGGQLGSSCWILLLGTVLLFADLISALVCLASFAILNAFGWSLWHHREQVLAYRAMQRLLLATTAIYAIVIVTLNLRGITQSQTPFGVVSTQLPYWGIALPPVLMIWFALREWDVKRHADRSDASAAAR